MMLFWLQVLALMVFLYGFFPVKIPVEGQANLDHDLPPWQNETIRYSQIPSMGVQLIGVPGSIQRAP